MPPCTGLRTGLCAASKRPVPGFVPLCRGLLSVGSDLASPIDRMGARLTAQTSRRKLALVAHRHRPAVRAERNRRILHIPDGPRAPTSCAHATLGTGRPLPAYSRRLVSMQAVEPFLLCAWDVSAPRGCSCCLRPGTRVRAVTSAHRAIRSRLQPTQMLQADMGRPTMAARQLAAVAQPLKGPLASARSCAPLRVRSITTGVSHL